MGAPSVFGEFSREGTFSEGWSGCSAEISLIISPFRIEFLPSVGSDMIGFGGGGGVLPPPGERNFERAVRGLKKALLAGVLLVLGWEAVLAALLG